MEDAAKNGGSAILGYDLWRDDGHGGDMVTIYGAKAATVDIRILHYTDYLVSKGTTYRYKYRARNINGWGDFSGVSYLLAASVPAQPSAPTMSAVDDNTMALELYTSVDTGGANIDTYELWKDAGELNTDFTKVSTYSGSASSLDHTLEKAADGLTPGKLYGFKFRSKNVVGFSPFSKILRVGFGSEPPAITTLTAVIEKCGPTYVAMKWDRVTTSLSLPVLGYIVQMIDPINDEWTDVLDESTNQDALSYVHHGVLTGSTNTFRAFAVNFNGRSS
jgi:hypothetical protein